MSMIPEEAGILLILIPIIPGTDLKYHEPVQQPAHFFYESYDRRKRMPDFSDILLH
jgi:hypothetical protein